MLSLRQFATSTPRRLSFEFNPIHMSSLGRCRYYRNSSFIDPLVPFRGTSSGRSTPSNNPFAIMEDFNNVLKSFDRDFFNNSIDFTPFSPLLRTLRKGGGMSMSSSLGSVDVHETDKQYIISVDCPGMTSDDVKLVVKEQDGGHILTISGERKVSRVTSSSSSPDTKQQSITDKEKKTDNNDNNTTIDDEKSSLSTIASSSISPQSDVTWHVQERSIGTFERHFWLPQNLDVESSSGDFTNGVLTVTFQKQDTKVTPKERTIDITTK